MAKRSKTRKAIPELLPWIRRDWLWSLILVVAVILVYQPVWQAGFIWDDDEQVTANPCIVGPLGLKEIWTTSAAQFYPLALTTFWMEHALWGLWPPAYHLVNVLVHGANAVLLLRVLRSLQVPGAWLGAALWALHPMQVESVAWVTELKNTQSGLFYLLSILFFVKGLRARASEERNAAAWSYGLTLLFAALAMASKSSTVVLPGTLCLCAWWVEGRWHWRNLARVAPIILMSLAADALAIWTVQWQGVNPSERSGPERLITVGRVVWFYLGKLLWPHPLMAIYPRWRIDATHGLSYLPLLALLILLVILWLKRKSWGRPYFFALAYFLVALFPVLGLMNYYLMRYSFVADHLQYLAGMGPLALIGAGLARWADWAIPQRPGLQAALGAGLLLILGVVSWPRARAYQSEETLWTDTLAKNPNCWLGYNNLGNVFLSNGRVNDAISQYRKALEINPHLVDVHNNLGVAFLRLGEVDKAIDQYQKALEINPDYAETYSNLGNAFLRKGQVDEAIDQYRKALKINPAVANAHANLGVALFQKGEVNEAIAQFQEAVRLKPYDVTMQNNLAKAKAMALQKGN